MLSDLIREPSRKRVAVLGCGPSGLAAAYAASLAGATVQIISDKLEPSPLYGAQYLHEPIPYASADSPVRIEYRLNGDEDVYRERVYGRTWLGPTSVQALEKDHDAWDLRKAYGALWDALLKPSDSMVTQQYQVKVGDVQFIKEAFDLVVSTIPADRLCPGFNAERIDKGPGHFFNATEIWAAGEAPEIGITLPYSCPENTVICNGDPDGPAWYRVSNIFGRKTVEWPGHLRWVPISSASRVRKPLETNCDCWVDEKFMRVGRYGAWEKSLLVHNSFNAVYERLTKES